jgi:tubulin polyglutamylase TTLL5
VQSADAIPKSKQAAASRLSASTPSLTPEESRIVRSFKAEFERRGGFVRIFPAPESWRRYSAFLDPTTGVPCTASPLNSIPFGPVHNLNLLLQRHLFPDQSTCTPRPDRLSRYERALLRGHRDAFMLDGDKGAQLSLKVTSNNSKSRNHIR